METKLILIEGIPGSGKSTIAKKISQHLETQNIRTALFCEGDIHPADLAWCSYIPINEYKDIINKHPQYSQVINKNAMIEGDHAVVAYTKLGFSPSENEVMKCFEDYEVYDGRVSLERFSQIHHDRWRKFAGSAVNENVINIFECAFLQNHICELMGIRGEGNDFITKHLISLISTVDKLNPVIIYLDQPDVNKTISRVAKERVSPDKSKYSDWIDLVIAWIEKSLYGKMKGLAGYDGAIEFFIERKMIEMEVIEKLPINKHIIQNPDYNWNDVFSKIEAILSKQGGINVAR